MKKKNVSTKLNIGFCKKKQFEPKFQPSDSDKSHIHDGFPCEQMCEQMCEQTCESEK